MVILGFFSNIWEAINNFFARSLKFDEIFLNYYQWFSQNVPEIFKWLILLLLVIIIILGTISLIKKAFKTFIVIGIILIIVAVVTLT